MIKKIVFLIGGTGNQLFQISKYGEDAQYNSIFLEKIICKIFKFTYHEQFLRVSKLSFLVKFLSFFLLILDLAFFKLLKFSLFTKISINLGKSVPIIKEFLILDYAVGENPPKDVSHIKKMINKLDGFDCLIHIRGGDLLTNKVALKKYGRLDRNYYINAMNHIYCLDPNLKCCTVTTDDIGYARSILSKIPVKFKLNYINIPVGETISRSISSKYFISSNSTLSYWMVILREEKYSIVPHPFWKTKNFYFDRHVHKIKTPY